MVDFSLADVVNELPRSAMTLFRESQGATINGRRRPGGKTSASFSGHVQPTTPKELQHIEGGENIEGAITIYTGTVLQTTNDILGTLADHVEHNGQRYKVKSAADWSGQGFRTFIAGIVRAEPATL